MGIWQHLASSIAQLINLIIMSALLEQSKWQGDGWPGQTGLAATTHPLTWAFTSLLLSTLSWPQREVPQDLATVKDKFLVQVGQD
jgi:hypothetical protein